MGAMETCGRTKPRSAKPARRREGAMQYRRLGRTGLQVSVLSFGSWVSFGPQLDGGKARLLAGRVRRWRELLRQRRVVRGRAVRDDHGPLDRRARLAPALVRDLDEGLLGPPRRREHDEHAEPQVPDAGHRRIARAVAARLRRRAVLPPLGSEHADRGDGVGDERHHRGRQGALLGHVRVVRRRDPRRVRDRGAAPPAPARRRAAAVPPDAPQPRRAGVPPALRRLGHRAHHVESARVRTVVGQVRRRCARRQPRHAARATSGCATRSPTTRGTRR